MFNGATGNQPSQYAHAVNPFTCRANFGHRSLNPTYAYDGDPPVRSGIIADNSAKNRHNRYPVIVMKIITGIADAPNDVTITGAIPVTKIVPANPITNAPHQFVSLLSPPPS